MANRNNIRKFRRPFLNIDMIIFGVIFIYVIMYIIMYFKTNHIVRYEVREGSLAAENTYEGIIIRDETLEYAQNAGYVNYYAREGVRVAKDSLVYIMDETGRLNENLEALNQDENALSNQELSEFRSDIIHFTHNFNAKKFETTYDFRYTLKNTVMKLASSNMLNHIDMLNNTTGVNIIRYGNSPVSGIVSYWSDGYENLEPKDVTEEMFDKKGYKKNQLISNSLVAVGDPVYKVSTSENWSLIIPIDAQRGAKLLEEDYIKVKFLKNQYESWAKVQLLTNSDQNTYIQLDFNNSMITFANDRFLKVELMLEEEKGLKIPVTSIVQKEFFLIPESFISLEGNGGKSNILKQIYMEDGTLSSEYLTVDVYNYDADSKEYYLDSSFLNPGDILIKQESQETYTVSKRATLIGVYNMNKGYADFKQINILYQNDEYAIVKSNTKYGLNVYDYIVLNADSVNDDQFIK